jgi:hypothetical protein
VHQSSPLSMARLFSVDRISSFRRWRHRGALQVRSHPVFACGLEAALIW